MRTKYKNLSHLIRCKLIEKKFKDGLKDIDIDADKPKRNK